MAAEYKAGDRTDFGSDPRALAREILWTRLVVGVALLASIMGMIGMGRVVVFRVRTSSIGLGLIDAGFAANITFLLYSSLFYQITRLAYLKRLRLHRPLSRDELEAIYERASPHRLAILVPSYKEEPDVVRLTLMSAALTEYPNHSVVLLIDDPPNPSTAADAEQLARTRQLVREIAMLMRGEARRYKTELAAFERRRASGQLDSLAEAKRLAALYRRVARWFERQAAGHQVGNHYDALYRERILLTPAAQHRQRAEELERSRRRGGLRAVALTREYRRLAALFNVAVSSFERKRYVNLSHAPNKAMNLNSYLGLMGGSYHETSVKGGRALEQSEPAQAHLTLADADYIITLDADSLLLGDYALRLTHIMDRSESARIAVVESPYTAVPQAPMLLERIAGAQTDVQWIGSQGATYYNASFWVGANALLRRAALDDLCQISNENGYPIKRYVRDRTLVEDTESTVELIARGWQVYCHPERLSYSATPRDYGALVIQRRRWANGPLLVIPKLLRHGLGGRRRLARLPETVLRLNTLLSALAAISMLLMVSLTFPDASQLPVVWLTVAALPYYLLYYRDLVGCGYEWWDLPRVYGLNLLLIPVNLAGVIKSMRQALTGIQPPFVRTPKVPGRTAAPAIQIVLPLLILAATLANTVAVLSEGEWTYASYGLLNIVCLGYAFISYVGLGAGWQDIRQAEIWPRLVGRRGYAHEMTAGLASGEG